MTVGQFREFVDEAGYRTEGGCHLWSGSAWEIDNSKSWHDPGFVQTDKHTAGCMNWVDAEAYAIWLARKTGQSYRFLSEAEWEYAQRAGGGSWPSRPWGLRSAFRNKFETGNRSNNFGFRLARPLSPHGVLHPDLETSTE